MTGTPSVLEKLIADCDAQGIRLAPVGDGGLTIDAPQAALTPELLNRLKAHKAELLAMLRPAPEAAAEPVGDSHVPVEILQRAKPVCRCGSTTWRDVPIHGGRSNRRDCGRCGRFLGFPVWHE